ncbi:MAG: GNAT family N-acetyltransferase [Ruminococcaceae bacterium]|nr:GNAT family N-acetyltransferase [Oscillospiraceae bacterium]
MAKTKRNSDWCFRMCTQADLDAVMRLQEIVCAALEDPDLFVATDREENRTYLAAPNFILGCFDGDVLAAYCSFVVPGNTPENYAQDLGWPPEKVCAAAKLDTIVVHPAYRGNGLQRELIDRALALAAHTPGVSTVLTTVSPKNQYSLHNVQAAGFSVLMRKLKYGGKERFILGRALLLPNNTETAEK